MSASLWREGFRKNGLFIAAFFILIGLAVYRYHAPTPITSNRTPASSVPAEVSAPSAQERDSASSPEQAAEVQKIRAILEDHQKRIDQNPQSEEAPGLLSAMGNLNFQRLGDYKEAARCYDLLIAVYPAWPGIKPAYHQLATCFQKLGDRENEQRVYKSMMKAFPEDSQEYAYAKKQLGL